METIQDGGGKPPLSNHTTSTTADTKVFVDHRITPTTVVKQLDGLKEYPMG